jgi:glucose/arabinose dehydrogenase
VTRAAAALLAIALAAGCASGVRADSAPTPRVVVDGLDFPTGIAFDARGRMYVNERVGRVRVVRGGELDAEPLAEVATTTASLETGLLGITLSPGGDSVYVFATEPSGATNRVLEIPLRTGEPHTVVAGIPAGAIHNGGGVAFDGDGMLLVSNGEQGVSERSQDPSVLGGKVYRLTRQGAVPPDNPFGGSPALAIGLRNPFGLAVDPVSGDPFVTDNGPTSDDEVNRIVPGGNYGWPVVMGPAEDADVIGLEGAYQDPLLDYPDIVVPTGIAFADPDTAPRGMRGDLFFGTYGSETIHRVRLDGARSAALSDEVFVDAGEPVIALAWGPRGLYYSTPSAVKVVPLARRATPGPDGASGRPRSGDGGRQAAAPSGKEDGGVSLFWGALLGTALVAVVVATVGALRRR